MYFTRKRYKAALVSGPPEEYNADMTHKIRWGILSTGFIAKTFAEGLAVLPDAELIAVGSRTQASADSFGKLFDIPRRYASYEALAQDPDVDVIYVATPHPFHKENSLLCLEAGKAVLCEKPFAINAEEAEAVIKVAQAKQLFIMEAMWTRFIPLMVKLRQLLAEGAIGEVRMLTADFGFRIPFNAQSRLLNPELGGGALLDVGIYPVSLAFMLFGGAPAEITSMAHLGQTGVDEQAAITFRYPEGQLALLHTAVRTETPQEAIIMGTEGRIKIHAPWWRPSRLTLSLPRQPDEVIDIPYHGNGYNYEAAEVMRCLRAGKLQSDTMPHEETLTIMQTLDKIRAQWGLSYPSEKK